MGWLAAVDIGASSGRVILGRLQGDRFETKEVHRFANEPVRLPTAHGVRLCWDAPGLFGKVCAGLERAVRDVGPIQAVGIDTWGVDYGLLDADGCLTAPVVNYRDHRTRGVPGRVFAELGPQQLYELTGTQVQDFNTVFQLVASASEEATRHADCLLLVPDLLGYWLTGIRATELTNASTTGLVDPRTRQWSRPLLDALPQGPTIRRLLTPLAEPGTVLGPVLPGVVPGLVTRAGEPTPVVHVGSHDTASAVAGVPAARRDFAYVSCGSWSLVGVELDEPVLTEDSRLDNFTNELGVDGRVRYLKNVSGMWVLNHAVAEWTADSPDFEPLGIPDLLVQAGAEPVLTRIIDLNDPSLIDPGPMSGRINALLTGTGQPVAVTRAQTVRAIMDSLALAYRAAIASACLHARRTVGVVHIVGGGSRNALLCQATADATGLPVVAGPAEGTALGNLLIAARAVGELGPGLARARTVAATSSELTRYQPSLERGNGTRWAHAARQLAEITTARRQTSH